MNFCRKALNLYNEGLQVKRTAKMYEYYITAVRDIHLASAEPMTTELKQIILTACEEAHTKELASANVYVLWVSLWSFTLN